MVIHDFHNNKIIFKDGLLKNIPNLLAKYRISGYDNTIIIGENAKVQSGQFAISGSRNYITIGANSDIRGFLIRADGMQNCVSIGEDVYFGGGGNSCYGTYKNTDRKQVSVFA